MSKKRFLLLFALSITIIVTVISAYFINSSSKNNTFTIGSVEIVLSEPNWNTANATDVIPLEEIKKDPIVKNIGDNDAFIFMEVEVPYKNVKVLNMDGTTSTATDRELFTYEINSGWIEVATAVKDTSSQTITHTYAYATSSSLTTLSVGLSTPSLFDSISLINVSEDAGIDSNSYTINVKAKAIQSTNIASGIVSPTEVLEVVNTQLSS